MIDVTTIVAMLGWALIAWLGVCHWRQIQAVRDWARANGLPLSPPKSRMRLARALEAFEPRMSGLWDGLWLEVWTRPMWAVSTKGGGSAYRMTIRVMADAPLTHSVQAPARLGHVTVRDRELRATPWGAVPLAAFPEYLSEAVAHARARSGDIHPTIEASTRA